ncbi:glycosyltransferase family 4 protein [Pseudanabaena sp. ABRG5-3]|uniref:glycosyltransferase family 4 protein n=1 Tax=Pseudanabaena sp. ABRG5-3 TaxID=685565 RepID=UPI000DC6DD85|nr:glycosyltransferase family 4 protein [Pseudanabaena sp. ABRG5-3]BBC24544.1 glycosyl transferase group 1 [Pseudanabaena sp. ABRG5-3]
MESHKTVAFFLNRVDCNDGIASHCETLIRGLRDSGWKVVLITGKVGFDDNSLKRLQALKELSEEWIIFDSFNQIFPSITSFFKILKAIKYHRIQIFHAHGYSMLFLTFVLKLFTGIKCVATSHLLNSAWVGEIGENKHLRLKYFLLKTYLKALSPKIFIAISSDIEQWLMQDIGINEKRIKKIFNGIDNKYFYPPSDEEKKESRAKFQISGEDFVVTLVGRLQWNKGHKILIDAANDIKKSNPKCSFKYIFAGSGDQREEIEKYAFENAENRQIFLFLGYVSEPRHIYWASDIIVLPSQNEGFPLVVLEAMACGIVSIRTPAAGAYDQIEDALNGFIIPFNDVDALASRLIQLSENTKLRSQMVANTLKYSAKKFTRESMTLDTIAAYEEAIAK